MRVTTLDNAEKVTPYKLEGAALFIGSGENTLQFDLENRQSDVGTCIDIRQGISGTLSEDAGLAYAANIRIPAARYHMVDTRTKNDKDEEVFQREKIALDLEEVELILWPLQYTLTNTETGGE